jgi:arylformamidase
MHIYDVSVPIENGMPTWPGETPLDLERVEFISKGAHANVSKISSSVHLGTHVDAPIHFIEGGSGVEDLSLRSLNGRAYVVELPKAKVIDAETLEKANIPPRTKRVLFKTRNSKFWPRERAFREDFSAVDASGAAWLVQKNVVLVGIDYLSIAPFGKGLETHRILLGNDVVIIEGMDLSKVDQGRYMLHCLPLKLVGSDGAPSRAILIGV